MPFKLHVADRNYESFDIINSSTLSGDEIVPKINPIEHKLFNQDIFDYDLEANKEEINYGFHNQLSSI